MRNSSVRRWEMLKAAAGATIFECLSGETLCMPKPFQDAVPSSSRSKVSAAPATTTSPRSTGRRTRSMGYLPPHPGRYSEQLHHLAQPLGGHPECGRFVEFNGSDARPVRLQVPARAKLRPSSRRSSLFTRLQRPIHWARPVRCHGPGGVRAASGKVAFQRGARSKTQHAGS